MAAPSPQPVAVPDSRQPPRNGTPTARDFAIIETQLAEARHDIRNIRQVLDGLTDAQRDDERGQHRLRSELDQMRVRITTGIAVATAIVSAGAWLIMLLK